MNKQYKILKYPQDLSACFKIRKTVFVQEQKFDEAIEIDKIDNQAHHILMLIDDMPVATARYFIENSKWHLGRFCVLKEYRKLGLGYELLAKIEEDIKSKGENYLYLSSQYPVREFYKKCGYEQVGEVYLEEDYPHIKMEKYF